MKICFDLYKMNPLRVVILVLLVNVATSQDYILGLTDFQNDWGGWYQESNYYLEWTRNYFATPSAPYTGPTDGHSGYSGGDYYAYIEASSVSSGIAAHLRSPLLPSVHNQTLQFYYHMYGIYVVGTLNVYRNSPIGDYILWTKSGDQGNVWNYAEVQFEHSGTGDNYILFEGIVGDSWASDIAIDDIRTYETVTTVVTTEETGTTVVTTEEVTVTPECDMECLNGGTCTTNDDSTGICQCPFGFTGPTCKRIVKYCSCALP